MFRRLLRLDGPGRDSRGLCTEVVGQCAATPILEQLEGRLFLAADLYIGSASYNASGNVPGSLITLDIDDYGNEGDTYVYSFQADLDWYLSTTPDRHGVRYPIWSGTATWALPAYSGGATDHRTALIPNVPPGQYYVIAEINRDMSPHEFDWSDNVLVFPERFTVIDPDDHGGTPDTATVLSVGGSKAGCVEVSGDIDFFAVYLQQGHTYSLETHAGTLVDTFMSLYSPDKDTVLMCDNDSGSSYMARIKLTALQSGWHYLGVSAKIAGVDVDEVGTYTIRAIEEDGPGLVSVTGRLTCQDTRGESKPLRFLQVNLYDKETNAVDEKLGFSLTDEDGYFVISTDSDGYPILNVDYWPEIGTRDLYVSALATTNAAGLSEDWIDDVLGLVWSVDSLTAYEVSDGEYNFGELSPVGQMREGAIVLDTITTAQEWLFDRTGWSRSYINVHWPVGDWPSYLPYTWQNLLGQDTIRIPEGLTTSFDDAESVVVHEYGHAVHQEARGAMMPAYEGPTGIQAPPGGGHWVDSQASPGFAFIEGWAEFFQCAVFDDPTRGGLSLETNFYWMGVDGRDGTNDDGNTGEVVEGAVASILWDLYDPANDDGIDSQFSRLWTVFLEDDPDTIWAADGEGDFYHAWIDRYGPSTEFDAVFLNHGIPLPYSPTVVSPIANLLVQEDAQGVVGYADLAQVFEDEDDWDEDLVYSVRENTRVDVVAATIAGAGLLNLTFLPEGNGSVDITVRATDPSGLYAEQTFTVTVEPVNDPPIAVGSAGLLAVAEDALPSAVDVSGLFADPDAATNGDRLTLTIVSVSPASLLLAGLDENELTVQYQPDQHGTGRVTLRATDQEGLFAEQEIVVNVTSVNDAPRVGEMLGDIAVSEDADDVWVDLSSAFEDVDEITGDQLSCSIASNSNVGLVTATAWGSSLFLSLADNLHGTATLVVRAEDDFGEHAEQSFTVYVSPVNDPPVVIGVPEPVNLFAEDAEEQIVLSTFFEDADIATDGDVLAYEILSIQPAGVSEATLAGGTLTLSSTAGGSGAGTVVVRAADAQGAYADLAIQVSASIPVAFGDGSGKIIYTDADGSVVQLSGTKCTGVAFFVGEGVTLAEGKKGTTVTGAGLRLVTVEVSDSSSKSKLVMRARGGNGVATVGRIALDGPANMVSAKGFDLQESLESDGAVSKIVLGDATGARITLGGHASDKGAVISLAQADGLVLESTAPVKSLAATDWTAGSVTAPSLGKLMVKGSFGADVDLYGTLGAGATLGSTKIGAAIAGGTWRINGDAKPIKAGSAAKGWCLSLSGQLAGLMVAGDAGGYLAAEKFSNLNVKGDAENFYVFAGADFGANGQLGGGDDTFAAGELGSVSIAGRARRVILGAGIDPVNGQLFDGDDTLLAGGVLKKLKIGGTAVETHVCAMNLPRKIKGLPAPELGVGPYALPESEDIFTII